MRAVLRDLTGQRFGMLIALSKEVVRDRYKWKCICDCGQTAYVEEANLIRAHTNSCGCLRKTSPKKRSKYEGRSSEPEFMVWKNIVYKFRSRVNQLSCPVEPTWVDSYPTFYEDMGPKPTPNHRMHRIDPALGFVKGNCIWKVKQRANRSQDSS